MNMKPPRDGSSSSYPTPPLTSSPLYIARKAKEILATRDVTEITNLVTKLCYEKENDGSSKLLYKCFTKHFPNLVAVKLLQVYRFATAARPKIRSYSLSLLDSLLIDLEDSRIGLKTKALGDIKEHLNACLLSQENSDHDFKLLSRIISRVAVDSFIENIPWDELCSYIISLHDDDKKTLLIFSELPMVLDENFLMPLLENNLHVKIVKGLLDPSCDEEWCLALEAGFNMALQLINLQRKDLVWDMVYAIVKSVWEMVNVGKGKRKILVRKGLMRIVMKVRREALRFREPEYDVVSRFALMITRINGVGKVTEMAAKMIHQVLDRYYMGGKGLDEAFIQSQIGINPA